MTSSIRAAFTPANGQDDSNESRLMVKSGRIWLHATLQLNKNDKVNLKLHGDFYQLEKESFTYFEGRLITKLDE